MGSRLSAYLAKTLLKPFHFPGVGNAPIPWENLAGPYMGFMLTKATIYLLRAWGKISRLHKLDSFFLPFFCRFFAFFFGAKFLFKKCKRTPRKPLVLQCFEVTFITGFVYKELIYKKRNKGNLFGNLFFTNKKRTIPQ